MNTALLIFKSASFFLFLFFFVYLFKRNIFLIFRYKQSHSGDDAEMNTVAECTITVPSAKIEKEGEKQGVKWEREGYEVRDTVLGWVEWKICVDREQYGRR